MNGRACWGSLVVPKVTPPIPFAGSQLDATRHVCAFFHSDDEGYRVLLPFIKDGFERGDKAVHLVRTDQYDRHLEHLSGIGIDPQAALQSGQLDVRINRDAYLREGRFDQDRMLAQFEEMAEETARSAYPLSRIICSMDWAYDAPSQIQELIEFESRVNDVWQRHEDAVICVYDLKRIAGDVVIDILRTHPIIVIGGMLQENPFYVPPEEFLREFRQRRPNQAV
jgi:hypothetical protein